jgi:hypothetical protein
MCGPAYRSHTPVIEPLLLEFAGELGRLPLAAAGMIADPRLYPALLRLHARGTGAPRLVTHALAACRPRKG